MIITSKRHPDRMPKESVSIDDVLLPEGLYLRLTATCVACECDFDYDGSVEDFDPDMAYCGRSYRCCP